MPAPLDTLVPPSDLVGILCDIDDTLTHEGRLVPGALLALQRAMDAGLRVVPVTGRPAGWVDQIARLWPVHGVVGENGGLWFWMGGGVDGRSDHGPERLHRRFLQSAATRRDNRARLDGLAQTIIDAVPGTALASDQGYRALDLAVDFCEDVPALGDDAIDAIVAQFTKAGAVCKVSSIHVNGWFGDFDKLAGIRQFHVDRWAAPIDPSRWIFFGDSANDEPMFGAFPTSVGVANVARFLPRMASHPSHITPAEGGHGFVQAIDHILAALGH